MLGIHDYWLFVLTGVLLNLTPGQDTMFILGRSLTGDQREIGDLPAYTFMREGEQVMQPCAERFLNEREIQALLDAGLVPVVSRRDRNAVVAVRFQSISQPPAPLPITSR